jgi:PAS domain S-box-containing protein
MLHVLLIEDEATLADVAIEFLVSYHAMEVTTVPSAQAGLELLDRTRFDAIICDYQMPVMDGLQLLKKLRQGGSRIPFVLFTGRGREEVAIDALNNGADGYLQKGGEPDAQFAELAHMVRTAVERRWAEECFIQLNECLAGLGSNGQQNIAMITATGGRLLRASFALYSRLLPSEVAMVASWNAPPRTSERSPKENNLCYEVVRRGAECLLLDELQDSPLAETMPVIRRHGISTFLSHVVTSENGPIGMLCVFYKERHEVSETDRRLLGILAQAIEAEEIRRTDAAALEASENKYRCLFGSIQAPIAVGEYVLDDEGEVEHWILKDANPMGLRLMGASAKEQVSGKGDEVLAHPDKEHELRALREMRRTRSPVSLEVHVPRTGQYFISSLFQIDEMHFINMFTDITGLKLAEQELAARERYLNTILETTVDGFCVIDGGREVSRANSTFCRMLGYGLDEIVGLRIQDMDACLTVEEQEEKVRRVKEDGSAIFETRHRRKDGSTFDVDISISYQPLTDDLICFTRDITERKWAENMLRESEEVFKNIFERNGAVMLIVDPRDGTIANANPAAAALYGWSVEQLKEMNIEDLTKESPEDVKRNLSRMMAEELSRYGLIHFLADGSRRDVDMHSSRIDVRGHPMVLSIIIDTTEQKRMFEALRREEEKYKALFAAENDGVFLIEAETGLFIESNDAGCRMLGYTQEELRGMTNADMSAEPEEIIDETRHGHALIPQRMVKRKDGTTFPAEINVSKFTLDGKDVLAAIVHDITQRKLFEDAIRSSERRYRTVTENASEGILVIQDWTVRFINHAISRMVQLDEGSIIGRPFLDFVHPDDAALVKERYHRRIVEDDIPAHYDLRVIGADGRVTWVTISGVAIDWDGRPATLDFATDITDRKQMEEELHKLARAAEYSPSCIVITDTEGGIEWVNPKFTSLTGYSLEDVKGQNPRILKSGDKTKQEYEKLWQTIKAGETWRGEFHNRKKSGELYWESASISPIVDKDGRITHFIASKEDITARKELEEGLRDTAKKLSIMNGITRHDVLNQVMTIAGSAALIEKRATDQEQMRHARKITAAAATIQRQMESAKVYQDIGVQDPIWLSLRWSVQEAASSLPLHELKVACHGPDYLIRVDPMFGKVIYNMIDNCLRHGDRAKRLDITPEVNAGILQITIEDDGKGLDPEEREHLFERGFGKNTGYGLFLSKEILGITGIAISEESAPGNGVRFILRIPAGGWRTA